MLPLPLDFHIQFKPIQAYSHLFKHLTPSPPQGYMNSNFQLVKISGISVKAFWLWCLGAFAFKIRVHPWFKINPQNQWNRTDIAPPRTKKFIPLPVGHLRLIIKSINYLNFPVV